MQNNAFKILFILLILLGNLIKAQTLCLSTSASFTTNMSSKPNTWGSPLSKDLNNDGKPDLIVNSYASGYFGISLGNGDGTFGSVVKFNVIGGTTNCNCLTALECDDYNNDGKKDIVVCAFDTLYLYNGNGLGSFSLLNKIKLGNYIGFFFPIKLIIQDFNNNGIKDLFCGDANGKGFILNGIGAGMFNYGNVFNSTISSSYNWFSNDFNNDGHFDLACFSPTVTSNCTSSIFYGNGNHTFQAQVNYGFYVKNNNLGFNSASLCDINNDGKMDIGFPGAILKNNTSNFSLIYNDTINSIEKVSFGYFNCDTIMDYHGLVRKTGYYESRFYYGNGNFNFPTNVIQEPLSPATLDYTYSFDFNQDGKFDLALTKQNEVYVVSNKPNCIQTSKTTNEICQNETLVLTASTANSYTWQPLVANTNTYSPTVTGNYYCLSNYAGQVCSSNTINVIVNPLPTLSVTATSTIICNGSLVSLNATGANTYTWSNSVINGASFTPTLTNTYTVYASDIKGCQNFTTETIVVNSNPTITVNSGSICSGNSFTMTPSGATTYYYSNGSSTVMPTSNNNYTVTGIDGNGCSNTAISSVTVNDLPTISVNSGSICSGQSFTMVANGASTYTYSSGSAVVSPTTNSTFNITGTSTQGCVSSNTAISSVTVNALPTVTVTNGAICSGQSFTMVPSGASTYTYSSGSAVVSPITNTNYTVTGSDINGCENNAISTVTVNTLPTVSIASSNSISCTSQTVTLNASGATSYIWSNSSMSSSISVSPTNTTTYTVIGTDANGCENMATITQTVSTCTGVDNQSLTASSISLTIYPNPTSDHLNISGLDINQKQISISNVVGENIRIVETKGNKTLSVDVENLSPGVYFINSISKSIKFIKE